MKESLRRSTLIGVLFVAVAYSGAKQALHTPAAGSPEREAIMNALRVPIEGEAKASVTFFQVKMKSAKGWAWVTAMAMDKAGKKYLLGKYSSQGIMHIEKGHWVNKWWGLSSTTDVMKASENMYPQAPKSIFFAPPK
jgi:hypothetical protein